MANKKRYVTYAPYHEEYLLYPCTFRGPDYTCNNADSPRYSRTCYARYSCGYDHVDKEWHKRYSQSKSNSNPKPKLVIVGKAQPRSIKHTEQIIFCISDAKNYLCPNCSYKMFRKHVSFSYYKDKTTTTLLGTQKVNVLHCGNCDIFCLPVRETLNLGNLKNSFGVIFVPNSKRTREEVLNKLTERRNKRNEK